MEIVGVSTEKDASTPKRGREDDTISPTSEQKEKNQKMSTFTEKDRLALMQMCSEFSSVKADIAAIKAIKEDVAEIKETQSKYLASIEAMESQVERLQRDVDMLKESGVGNTESELLELRRKNHSMEQLLMNERLVIRNLPIEIKEKKEEVPALVERIFTVLNLDVDCDDFEAYATPTPNKKLAKIEVKFSSAMLKARVLRKFRDVKRRSTDDSPFIVEKIVGLPNDHELNGKLLSITNKLTPHNAQLIKSARKLSPSHFDYAYDSPEGVLFVKIGEKSHRIDDESDIQLLKEEVEKNRETSNTNANQSGSSQAPMNRRSGRNKSNKKKN